MAQSSKEITQRLVAWSNGDRTALDQLIPLVPEELRRLAKRYMRRVELEEAAVFSVERAPDLNKSELAMQPLLHAIEYHCFD
jgi:hypothetical protein